MALAKSSAAKKKPVKAELKEMLAGIKKKAGEKKADSKANKKAVPEPKGSPAKALAKKPAPAAQKMLNSSGKTMLDSKGGSARASGRGDVIGKERSTGKIRMKVENRSLINDQGEAVCREVACEGLATTGTYCRMHYIKNWKKIKRKELILKERKLNQYIEELVAKYPDKYIEAIRQDLSSDKDFAKVINDLDLDESIDDFDTEGDSVDSFIDNIRRDFDDEGESF